MVTNLIGVIGLIIILINLFLLETSRVQARSKEYLLINFAGSFLLVWYSWLVEAHIFLVINSVFVFLSLFWLFRLHR